MLLRWSDQRSSDLISSHVSHVVTSGQWSYGPVCREAERYLACFHDIPGAVVTNSGTSGLWALLARLRKPDRYDQAVIIPAFGYVAAGNVAASLGFRIYVADSEPSLPVVSTESVSRLMDRHVVAVVGINYFGCAVDWSRMPREEGVFLIEDAAGSFGARYCGSPLGTQADAGIISFHTSKGVASGGEGGCILSRDTDVLSDVLSIAKHGRDGGFYDSAMLGLNLLMTDLSAEYLIDSLCAFEENLKARRAVKTHIDDICEKYMLKSSPSNSDEGTREQNHQCYLVLEPDREYLIRLLRTGGIEAMPCWPTTLLDHAHLRTSISRMDGDAPNAQRFARLALNLPIHPNISSAQLAHLESALERWRRWSG